MKKALLTATVQSHIAQFHRPLIKILKKEGYEIHIAAKDNLFEKNGLDIRNIDRKYNIPFERSPLKRNNIKAFFELRKIIREEQYDIISCNTPMGGIVTRLATIGTKKKKSKLFYTAHGFHFYKGAPKKNWFVFYPIEKVMAHFTDVLITITKEDYKLALKKFKTEIKHIYGIGADENKYLAVTEDENIIFRKKMGYDKRKVILCTGELNENKNQITLIRAISQIVTKYSDVLLLLAGNGPKEDELRDEIKNLGMEEYVTLLGYHTDLEKYTNACNIVVSVSFREGMPLNILEAMICEKPIVASNNRGHRELISHGENGYLVQADNIEDISDKILELLENKEKCEQFSRKSKERVQPYLMKNVEKDLMKIYL